MYAICYLTGGCCDEFVVLESWLSMIGDFDSVNQKFPTMLSHVNEEKSALKMILTLQP